jgi:phytoene dehydrogenase-like protein
MAGERWDAIVIGSGLGGLTAAAHWAAQGLRVLVLERNAYFGGAACTYRHAGLQIEASLHEINGVTPGDPKMKALAEAGVLDKVAFAPVPEFAEVRGRVVGEPLILPNGFNAFEAALIHRFPAAEHGVRRHLDLLRGLHRSLRAANEDHGPLWWLTHGPGWLADMFPALWRGRSSVHDAFADFYGEIEGPKAAQGALLEYFSPDPRALWFAMFSAVMASYIEDGGYYVKGGSGAFANAFASAIRGHGGVLRDRREAVRILATAEGVQGVVHHGPSGDIETDYAPVVFGNAAPSVLAALFDPPFAEDFAAPYRTLPLSTSLWTMSFGVVRPPSAFGIRAYSTAVYPDWMERMEQSADCPGLLAAAPDGRLPKYLITDQSKIDSGLSHSKGRHILTVTGADHMDNWRALPPAAAADRKARWVEAIVADLDRRFPGLAGAFDWKEMANAQTMARFMNTPDGAVYGFAPAPPDPLPHPPRIATQVPGLYLASAYTVSGGYTGAITGGLMAARAALQRRQTQSGSETLYA